MATTAPLVSVVITVFNRADTVVRAIDSVRAQSFGDWEIVLVDDASTDSSVAVVEALNEPRLRLVRNPVNRGIGGAKNVGLAQARGRYIAFLDSDDEWLPEKLERQLALMAAHPEQPLCFTAFRVRRRDGREVLRQPVLKGGGLDSQAYGETFALGSTLLATRECFERVGGFDESIRRMEDREWSLRYFNHYESFLLEPTPLARLHNSGWPSIERVEESIPVLWEACRPHLARHPERLARLFRASLEFERLVAFYRCGRRSAALAQLARVAGTQPSILPHLARRALVKLARRDFA